LIVAAKGAAEAIAELCHLSDEDRARERSAADEMAREGMRVLGMAKASVPVDSARPDTPRGFQFEYLGLIGIADLLRPAVPEAVKECQTAGIRVVMITGDYPQTACAIAFSANLKAGDVVTGSDLE